MTETNRMTLEDAKTHVLDNSLELLAQLCEYRLAIYEEYTAHSFAYVGLVPDTKKALHSAFEHRARLGIAAQEAHNRLYSLLTAGIAEHIRAEETEAKGEAFGT